MLSVRLISNTKSINLGGWDDVASSALPLTMDDLLLQTLMLQHWLEGGNDRETTDRLWLVAAVLIAVKEKRDRRHLRPHYKALEIRFDGINRNKQCIFMVPDERFGGKIGVPEERSGS